MAAKANTSTPVILGIIFGIIVGLVVGSLWVANQLPHTAITESSAEPSTASQINPVAQQLVPTGTIIEQSCHGGGDNDECLFLQKGSYMPIGTGYVTGRYIGLQERTDWEGETVSCPVFAVTGGSGMIREGLERLSDGIVPVVDGELWWFLGPDLAAAQGFNASTVKVGVSLTPLPDVGAPACYSPMQVESISEKL
jgi:hypothetical protein